MAFFRAVRPLLRNGSTRSLLVFDLAGVNNSSATPVVFPTPSPTPLICPLFLSFPPWKLSQISTPLDFRGNVEEIRNLYANSSFSSIGDHRRRYLGGITEGKRRAAHESERGARDKEVVGVNGSEEKFFNVPNLISISRMVSGPFIGWMILNDLYLASFFGLAISGLTDWLDGYVARRMNINSVFGSYLDPLADKVLIGCVALAMVEKDLLHSGVVALVVLRDVLLVGGAVWKRASSLNWKWKSWSEFLNLDATHREKVEPLFISKVNTVFQLFLVAVALLQPEFGTDDSQMYITYLSWLVASTTVGSFAAYGGQYMRLRRLHSL